MGPKKLHTFLAIIEYSDETQYAMYYEGTDKKDVKRRLEKNIKNCIVHQVSTMDELRKGRGRLLTC